MASTACDILTMTIPGARVSISGTAITITVAEGTDVSKLVPTITVSAGATVDPASGVPKDFSSAVTYTVTAEDGTTDKEYTATVAYVPVITAIPVAGMFAVRHIEGTLRNYASGGIDLGLGSFEPKICMNVQLSGGNVGYYDVAAKKLMAYSAAGTEATASATVKFSVLLMGQV